MIARLKGAMFMNDMYRELILDHAKHQRNRGLLDPASIDHEEHNPLCGDRLRLTLQVDENNVIKAVGWDGEGCAISQAAASMLGERVLGLTLDEVKAIDKQEVLDMIGIPLTMNRVKCALLSLKVLQVGVYGLAIWQAMEDEEN